MLSALHAAFPHKQLMARNPDYASCQQPWLGFHDDLIPEDTLGPVEWHFLPSLERAAQAENWKVAPTGGEMVPGQAEKYLGSDWATTLESVKKVRFTWIGPYSPPLAPAKTSEYKARAEELIRKFGYEYRFTSVAVPAKVRAGHSVSVNIHGANQGVAPFYYPWQIELALLSPDGKVAGRFTQPDDIRTWLPGLFALHGEVKAVNPGKHQLGIGIRYPWTKKTRIRFANALPLMSGYTVLTTLEVGK